jgi:hypothetical protein
MDRECDTGYGLKDRALDIEGHPKVGESDE